VQVTRPLVMPTEVINLPNLTGYLRFGRDLPVIRFRDRYRKGSVAQPGFIDRTSEPVRIVLGDQEVPDAPVEPKPFRRPDAADDAKAAAPSAGKWPAAHTDLFGPRDGEDRPNLRQQSRAGKPWRPSKPA
jgi:hypothetical protein